MGIRSLVFVLTSPNQWLVHSTVPVLFSFTLATNIVSSSSMVQLTTILVVLVTLGLTAKVSHAGFYSCMEGCGMSGGARMDCNNICGSWVQEYCRTNDVISDAGCKNKCDAFAKGVRGSEKACSKVCEGVKCNKKK